MKFLGVIPARYASTRFPGKPLALINGKPMIERVYIQAMKAACLETVIVATDDDRILDAVTAFGGKCMMTSPDHTNGTGRCAEVAASMKAHVHTADVIINIQGDEPYIHPGQIDQLSACFTDASTEIATLVRRIQKPEDIQDPNIMKVVFDRYLFALYFSRSPIPFTRSMEKERWLEKTTYYKHIGMYAFRSPVLEEIVKMELSSLEKAESLEQLRWLENGKKIKLAITDEDSYSIDIPEDLRKFINMPW
jgi:3-deoxy-manno-octulosonate cytidylyltransferase (CMP-KDO synthetase)